MEMCAALRAPNERRKGMCKSVISFSFLSEHRQAQPSRRHLAPGQPGHRSRPRWNHMSHFPIYFPLQMTSASPGSTRAFYMWIGSIYIPRTNKMATSTTLEGVTGRMRVYTFIHPLMQAIYFIYAIHPSIHPYEYSLTHSLAGQRSVKPEGSKDRKKGHQ